ncbi:MAG: hypothetical protein IJU98_04970, partial [Synergistaceae bacterium]|nr:hypothetical protein [Synergistaceae bacterium]
MKRVLALALALCALCVPAWAATWNVGNVNELSQALRSAANGDVISMAAGTYNVASTLSITKSVAIQGANRDTTILDGGGS